MKFLREIISFIIETKKWWLVPILTVLLIVGLLVLFADTAVAPFIYSLF
ncbi:MAG: DUF5989 family protein [Prevotella sp.]|nr:DUF5989 family protein [Prevotella sp.]MDD7318806.1 DUF5989 family protein [Prevotellaceae bacterium]MDY4019582.1 DUF5989 family protein [Prevotella sp.]